MHSLGFGTERVVWPVLKWPRAALVVCLLVLVATVYGIAHVRFDENLRDVFAGKNKAYDDYVEVTNRFVDPENEIVVLIEGAAIGEPKTFARLRDLQFELQLLDGVGSVYSMFALREAPDEAGDAALTIGEDDKGLTPELVAKIRAHPLLGAKVLARGGDAAVFVVTPQEAKAPIAVTNALKASIEATISEVLGDAGIATTVTGFPAIRGDLVDIMVHDQLVLNVTGAIIGLIMSLIVFRSFVAAVMTAVPAMVAGAMVLGVMGLIGAEMTVMSNIVPALVMILGYADATHLSFAWRHDRDHGATPAGAARRAQHEVGPACMLTAITTALAFLSLTISDVGMVSGFGWIGAVSTLFGGMVVLVFHALLAQTIGRYWKTSSRATPNLLSRMRRPSAMICRFSVTHARVLEVLAIVLLVSFAAMHFSVPPQHSMREHLPLDNPANAALGRLDQHFDGVFPVQIIIPLDGVSATSPEGLEKIGKVHEAVAAVEGANTPLSLWSVRQWLGGDIQAAARQLDTLLSETAPETRSRFISDSGTASLMSVSLLEAPTHVVEPLIDKIEAAAKAAGGGGVTVTGLAVLTARESDRSISSLNLSLTLAVFSGLIAMVLAFRDWRIGVIAFLPNALPIVATGALLYLTGRGMQYTSVLSLTVAFGIAIDDTIHYLNRFRIEKASPTLDGRLIETSRHIGPVLLGTFAIIIAGLSTTLFSALPSVTLFGELVAVTLAAALVGDLFVLPALMAGAARRWFEPRTNPEAAAGEAPARA